MTITNDGEIDTTGLRLIGASTKRGDSTKIGFFGSGTKNAIAIMLRNNIPFKIYSGDRQVEITTRTVEFRGDQFQAISIDGHDTGYTTGMGVDWQSWMTVREFYSNAIDEGGCAVEYFLHEPQAPGPGKTLVAIYLNEHLYQFADNPGKYIIALGTEIPAWEVAGARFYRNTRKGTSSIYRRGILIHESTDNAFFNVDLDQADIDESRVMKNPYQYKRNVMPEQVAKIASPGLILRLCEKMEFIEEKFMNWGGSTFNAAWLEAIHDRYLVPAGMEADVDVPPGENPLILPMDLIVALQEAFEKKMKGYSLMNKNQRKTIERENITPKEERLLTAAVNFIINSEMVMPYQIEIAEFTNKKIHGFAHFGDKPEDSKIVIARNTLQLGRREVVATILEEMTHLESGAADFTRHFQNALINKIIQAMEAASGETL